MKNLTTILILAALSFSTASFAEKKAPSSGSSKPAWKICVEKKVKQCKADNPGNEGKCTDGVYTIACMIDPNYKVSSSSFGMKSHSTNTVKPVSSPKPTKLKRFKLKSRSFSQFKVR